MPSQTIGTSFVLDERSRTHYADVRDGALSVKCMLRGGAWYELEGTRILLEGPRFLLLNHGQPYKIEIDEVEPVESFCVFFGSGMVEAVQRSRMESAEYLLDDPYRAGDSVRVADRLYRYDDSVMPALRRLRRFIQSGESDKLEDGLYSLAESILESQDSVRREVESTKATRLATRHELYRRLYRGRDFIDSHLDRPVNLFDVAGAACMSPHHFHRAFRQAFQQTPHGYATARRIERARNLLASSEVPVMDVCVAVGFESLPSFTTLFRRHVGLTPAQFRKIR